MFRKPRGIGASEVAVAPDANGLRPLSGRCPEKTRKLLTKPLPTHLEPLLENQGCFSDLARVLLSCEWVFLTGRTSLEPYWWRTWPKMMGHVDGKDERWGGAPLREAPHSHARELSSWPVENFPFLFRRQPFPPLPRPGGIETVSSMENFLILE